MNYAIGIAENGERLRFERWVYESYMHGSLGDAYLLKALRRCHRFTVLWSKKEVV